MAKSHPTHLSSPTQEIWKPIGRPNCHGYEISSLGQLATHWRKGLALGRIKKGRGPCRYCEERKILVLQLGRDGYYRTRLILHDKEGVSLRETWVAIHILVLETFVGPRPVLHGKKAEVRHLNDIRTDNRLENLAWGTRQDNANDAVKNDKVTRGEQRWNTVVSEQDVLHIRELYGTGKYNQAQLADRFGIDRPVINLIINNKTWTHLPPCKPPPPLITDEEAQKIRRRWLAGESQHKLAKEYGVAQTTIGAACHGKHSKRPRKTF